MDASSAARSTAGAPGRVAWTLAADATIFAFALWWECNCSRRASCSRSARSASARTGTQIYLPLLEPLIGRAGDEVSLAISSETGGDESGIDVRWTVEQHRGGTTISQQALDIGQGFLG